MVGCCSMADQNHSPQKVIYIDLVSPILSMENWRYTRKSIGTSPEERWNTARRGSRRPKTLRYSWPVDIPPPVRCYSCLNARIFYIALSGTSHVFPSHSKEIIDDTCSVYSSQQRHPEIESGEIHPSQIIPRLWPVTWLSWRPNCPLRMEDRIQMKRLYDA